MKVRCVTENPLEYKGKLLVFFVGQEEKGAPLLPNGAGACAEAAVRHGDFTGKKGQSLLCYPESATSGQPCCDRVLLVGLGKAADTSDACREQLRLAGGTASARAMDLAIDRAGVVIPQLSCLPEPECAAALAEGLLLANYRFAKYKKTAENGDAGIPLKEFVFLSRAAEEKAVRRAIKRTEHTARAVCTARDMAHEPGNSWTPQRFAEFAQELAQEKNLVCRILKKADMKALGMGGILGVSQGSGNPPFLTILEYHAGVRKPTLLLVGKGLTFDSGGVSLKPAAGMEDMKYDMCGGAAVLCAMQAIAALRPTSCNVVAMVPASENMSGCKAIKPGDIITHYNGKTSEVVNTDAEGRLLLADALAYGIEQYQPQAVVDLATLTGAVIIGLGHHRTGLLSNNDTLAERILAAGEGCGEPLWRLPLGPEYSKQLESKVADLKNVGGKAAGTITAAAYLHEFVGETPWAHLDIAGTAWEFTEKSYVPKGPSGIAVRTLIALVEGWAPLPDNGTKKPVS